MPGPKVTGLVRGGDLTGSQTLYTRRRSLKLMRCWTGSQWNFFRVGVIWSDFSSLATILAAVIWGRLYVCIWSTNIITWSLNWRGWCQKYIYTYCLKAAMSKVQSRYKLTCHYCQGEVNAQNYEGRVDSARPVIFGTLQFYPQTLSGLKFQEGEV